jgi:GH43 family beta-xylosidase
VFPVQPGWAEGSFWAPELVEDAGRFFLYYVARARGGTLSIAVATANAPGGPWRDRGPIHTEPLGAIDPAFARDERGAPFLIWKTDGNSQGEPTPIWARRLSDDLLSLMGEPTMLISGDQEWEGGIVEGPYVLRHARRFYLFYAGNTCCGRFCKYAEGVARADRLLGPWTKYPGNPLIGANESWRCPGHGTAVGRSPMHGKKGQDYLLYHAYPSAGDVFVGREAVLDEIRWGADGWPVVNAGKGPRASATEVAIAFADAFDGPALGGSWQWPVNTVPEVEPNAVPGGGVRLRIPAERQSAILAVPAPGNPRYVARVRLCGMDRQPGPPVEVAQPETPTYGPPRADAWCGLMLVGDPFNTIGLGVRRGELELWVRRGSGEHLAWSSPLPGGARGVWLRTRAMGDGNFLFDYSADGVSWSAAGGPVDASPLPAWDRGLRIALMLEGPGGTRALFREFSLHAPAG